MMDLALAAVVALAVALAIDYYYGTMNETFFVR